MQQAELVRRACLDWGETCLDWGETCLVWGETCLVWGGVLNNPARGPWRFQQTCLGWGETCLGWGGICLDWGECLDLNSPETEGTLYWSKCTRA